MSHSITKFIRKYDSYYTCYTCNTSYPTKKSLAEDHDMKKTIVTIQIKRGEPSLV